MKETFLLYAELKGFSTAQNNKHSQDTYKKDTVLFLLILSAVVFKMWQVSFQFV